MPKHYSGLLFCRKIKEFSLEKNGIEYGIEHD